MKIFKFREIIKEDNQNIVTEEDIINVIENDGVIYTNIVDDYPDHKEDDPLTPISIDNGEIIVYIDGNVHIVDLKFVKSYEL